MRPLELLSVITGVTYLLWLSFGTGIPGSPFQWLAFVAAGVAVCQIKFEGYRWHMIPGYLFTAGLLLLYPWCQAQDFRLRLTDIAILWLVTAVLIGACGILAGILYPVFTFVPLTGKYHVGTFAAHLVDVERTEPYAPCGTPPRELMVQAWYPAEKLPRSSRARYGDGVTASWRTSNLGLVKTRSFANAPVLRSGGKLPVLLFTGPDNRFQNTFETEELASHGYLVIALDHPYSSSWMKLPNGQIIRRRKENVFLDFQSDETLSTSTVEVTADLEVRVADVNFLIAQLEKWERGIHPSPLAGSIDVSRIGIFGHSFGGAVAAEACLRSTALQAGINMDGWLFGQASAVGVPKPFFFMLDCTPRPSNAVLDTLHGENRRTAQRTIEGFVEVEGSLNRWGGYLAQAPGLEHMNFSDSPLYSRLSARTGAGAIDFRRAHSLINRLTLAFFDVYLRNASECELDRAAASFPEAVFRRFDRSGSVAYAGKHESREAGQTSAPVSGHLGF
ncbi:MAG: hypothetical protein WA324_18010 [Bryobacteraceae bacterium]